MLGGRFAIVAVAALVALTTPVPSARAATTVTEAYRVRTPHGLIYGEVVRPATSERVPVILTYSPYNHLREPDQAESSFGDEILLAPDGVADFFVPRGYARAVFDVVGTRSSTGCFDDGGPREQATGAAVVEHLASQPWSNGRVGMIGVSYDGQAAIATARAAPPHLAAVIAQAPTTRIYDFTYVNGVRTKSLSPLMYDTVFGLGSTEPEGWVGSVRPCDEVRHARATGGTDPTFGSYWAERDHPAHAASIRAPVMIEQGWIDNTVRPTHASMLFRSLPPATPKHLVAGRWGHGTAQLKDAQDRRLAWFDTYLKGIDRGVSTWPPVWTRSTDAELHAETSWPPAGARQLALPLSSFRASGATWIDADRTLNDTTMLEASDLNGEPNPAFVKLVLPPLGHNVRIAGPSALDLVVVSSMPETHLAVLLFEQGNGTPVTGGYLNVRNRNGLHVSEPVRPGEAYRASVPLWDTDHVVYGHSSLVLYLASTNAYEVFSDQFAPSTNTVALAKSTLRLTVVDHPR